MKNLTKFAVMAVVVLTCAAMLQPANAICGSARLFKSGNTYIYTPGCQGSYYGTGCDGGSGDTSMTSAARGRFWAVGTGDPAVGPGNDNGSFEFLGGWAVNDDTYPMGFNSSWAKAGVDNCVDAAPNKCMAILLTDNVDTGNQVTGAFALLTNQPDSLGNYDFDQGGHVTLQTVPGLRINGSARTGGGTGVDIQLSSMSLAEVEGGLHLDSNCTGGGSAAGDVLQGFQIFAREATRNDPPQPPSNDASEWTKVGGVNPFDGPDVTVSVPCNGDNDVWVAAGIVFDSGFTNDVVAGHPTTDLGETLRVECGANLAEPDGLRIERKPRSRELPRSRTRGR